MLKMHKKMQIILVNKKLIFIPVGEIPTGVIYHFDISFKLSIVFRMNVLSSLI
jgi:hypothetical protein